jgi:hypothetical protein
MVHSQLKELGEKAVTAVAADMAQGAPLVKCQLLASRFYDALRRELRKFPQMADADRKSLLAAVHHCERVASAASNPNAMLNELRRAIAMLPDDRQTPPPTRERTFLRVIEGGLSKT